MCALPILASGATLTLNADGSYVYNGDTITGIENQPFGTPVPDSFTYTVTDGHGDTNTGTVHITVNVPADRKSTRLNSSHQIISYAVFCFKTNFTSGSDDPPTLQPGVSGPHH